MATGTVDFTDVKWTMLVTLYHRARDSRSARPILGDTVAAEAIDRIDYDFGSFRMRATSGDRALVVLRAKRLDEWASDFLARHPEATVLQLGCGLDGRAIRLDLPERVRWFDVDLPEVIELRRRIYEERPGYRMIGSSVTDTEWLAEIPAERPVLVIAEGLLMYLEREQVRTLLSRITERFSGGELLFDGAVSWVVRVSRMLPGFTSAFRMNWSIDGGAEIEHLIPTLRRVEERAVTSESGRIGDPVLRGVYELIARTPLLKDSLRLYRFAFGETA
ncbi:class I SAM-dependent methyltransferase [Sciscionella marina]|uniref:class I SAM-dependent methyltransferase n=1 Tax=Sciscionella marina TaxID=508770 RepID=UPI0003649699|nr:class I SAM-dependent methyltransferase [Sciscionella marina]